MGMTLTKDFVNHCRNVGALRDFLCQAIDQVDAKDKEIAEIKQQYNDMDIAKMNAKIEELEATERRLKRALYKALTNWAKERSLYYYSAVPNRRRCRLWEKVETKCFAMADKFKETDNGNDKL